ncbi:hypothetical protein [Isoptericola sp. NPDC055881]
MDAPQGLLAGVGALGEAFLLAFLIRGFAMWVVARIRLTDVVGYVTAACGVLVVVTYVFDTYQSDLLSGTLVALGVAGGLWWTIQSKRARERDPDHVLLGMYIIRRQQPSGTRNWLSFSDSPSS